MQQSLGLNTAFSLMYFGKICDIFVVVYNRHLNLGVRVELIPVFSSKLIKSSSDYLTMPF